MKRIYGITAVEERAKQEKGVKVLFYFKNLIFFFLCFIYDSLYLEFIRFG